ncbi:hypothetical protein K488DRAFT_74016 [Vararia minispora EC-137]|uniref:Uncharacterized protein n=1 Tax=Vararia minispora EC-137 TaxID=1314806 RepID=A0ACB8Q9D3_9AGAM|nr:hypothetical protein K488DRAFT_74016 [Vararia minispora EC-137]
MVTIMVDLGEMEFELERETTHTQPALCLRNPTEAMLAPREKTCRRGDNDPFLLLTSVGHFVRAPRKPAHRPVFGARPASDAKSGGRPRQRNTSCRLTRELQLPYGRNARRDNASSTARSHLHMSENGAFRGLHSRGEHAPGRNFERHVGSGSEYARVRSDPEPSRSRLTPRLFLRNRAQIRPPTQKGQNAVNVMNARNRDMDALQGASRCLSRLPHIRAAPRADDKALGSAGLDASLVVTVKRFASAVLQVQRYHAWGRTLRETLAIAATPLNLTEKQSHALPRERSRQSNGASSDLDVGEKAELDASASVDASEFGR